MISDHHTKPNHQKIIIAVQVSIISSLLLQNEEELESTAKANPHPFILIKGTYTDEEEIMLVIDTHIVMNVVTEHVPLSLMSAFFVFNVCYPNGCTNFFSLMEVFALDFTLKQTVSSVKHLLSSLFSINP